MWEPGFYENLPPIEGAIAALQEMTQHPSIGKVSISMCCSSICLISREKVFLCTSPLTEYEHCVLEKYHWVEKHLGPSWVLLSLVRCRRMLTSAYCRSDKSLWRRTRHLFEGTS